MEVMFKGLEWNSRYKGPKTSGQWEPACIMPPLKVRLDKKTSSKTRHLGERQGAKSHLSVLTLMLRLTNYPHAAGGWGYPELGQPGLDRRQSEQKGSSQTSPDYSSCSATGCQGRGSEHSSGSQLSLNKLHGSGFMLAPPEALDPHLQMAHNCHYKISAAWQVAHSCDHTPTRCTY